jgi:hypothetical protein
MECSNLSPINTSSECGDFVNRVHGNLFIKKEDWEIQDAFMSKRGKDLIEVTLLSKINQSKMQFVMSKDVFLKLQRAIKRRLKKDPFTEIVCQH